MSKKKQLNQPTKMQMIAMLLPYDNWDGDKSSVRNAEAKNALLQFWAIYKDCKLDKEYVTSNLGHLSYLFKLIPIKAAFNERNYQRACNELITLIHEEPIYQKRIHCNLICLLEESLNV